jgi:pimeloyl-ACP methyl ester carboxylesterase
MAEAAKRKVPNPGQSRHAITGKEARARLLERVPVSQRRLELAGIATAVLEGGAGSPVVLLHGPSGYAAHWMRVIPALVGSHRVIAPDLPGHGESRSDETLDADQVLAWLGDLIDRTCETPPALVGQLLGGAIAARFAIDRSDRIHQLVLVDSFGLRPFQPAPEFGLALEQFLQQPGVQTHRHLWGYCAFDIDTLRQRMSDVWDSFEMYNIDLAGTASTQAALASLMRDFGFPAISSGELARIGVPTALIWGRHDLATPLAVAEAASTEFGWPLQVIDRCADDPPIEQPEALSQALLAAFGDVSSAWERTEPL